MLVFAYYNISVNFHFQQLNNFWKFSVSKSQGLKITNIGILVEVDYHSR